MKAILALLLLILPAMGNSQELVLLWNSRPPYMVRVEDSIVGLTASVVIEALESTGIPYEVREVPSNRQIADVQANRQPLAALGWFKNPERETYARFSVPLYRDNPFVVIYRRDNAAMADKKNLDELFADRNLDLVVKNGYSYGAYVDAKIRDLDPSRIVISSESIGMIKMINAGRGDYLFMAPEETAVLIAAAGLDPAVFSTGFLSDVPSGEKRYLMYSKMVSEEIIAKVDEGIAAALAARGIAIR